MKKLLLSSVILIATIIVSGQEASVKEQDMIFTVYPFSEPDPVARPGTIYPYFRFDGYTSDPVVKNIRMVVLENRWLKIWIAPVIGGKIWGALNKIDNKYFIYYNNVVKFRDIAMRGAWTSGGIEFNFGIIGHAPTTAAPVDYFIRRNPDGSASCFLGSSDLPSGTEWRVEVRLPKDKAYFEVNSNWNNPSDLKTSLYHWQTAAANASPDLQFYFPGKAYIDHGGNSFAWPVMEDGRDISMYRNNNYNSSHSYHVLGEYTDWFAGYYPDSGYGFGHWVRYPYKPGKKIWIWDLSRAGAIWEDLLTDTNKGNTQYIEMQTGLLFNQEADQSTMSPFKHLFFEPGATENFSEFWFPLHDLKGVSSISREGILDIEKSEKGTIIRFQSLMYLNDRIQVTDSTGTILHEFQLNLEPEQITEKTVDLPPGNITVKLAGGELLYKISDHKSNLLDRPLKAVKEFDWGSVYGLYTLGIEKLRQRSYSEGAKYLNQCISRDPSYLPALCALAEIDIRQLRYDEAEKKLLMVLGFNTYDPDANWLYGVILQVKGQLNKARDAYGITLRSPLYKAGALNRLALIALRDKRFEEAWDYISDAGRINGSDKAAYRTAAVTARLRGDQGTWEMLLRSMSNSDPLSHFADFERFFILKDSISKDRFISKITNEFAYETFIEIALWYYRIGLNDEALAVMEMCPQNPLADFLSAYLASLKGDSINRDKYLVRALGADDKFVFPFRSEYEEILKWADSVKSSWKTKYYLALLYWSRQRTEEAGRLFNECGDLPESWSFFLTRGNFMEQTGSEGRRDYLLALKLDSDSWRPHHILHNYYVLKNNYEEALAMSEKAMNSYSASSIIRFDHAISLLYTGRYDDCVKLLQGAEFLPHEGSGDGRMVWKFANLLNALKNYHQNNSKKALESVLNAYKWPENLGVGKPFKVDEREEDFICYLIFEKLGRKKLAIQFLKKVADYNERNPEDGGSVNYLTTLALKKLGLNKDAEFYLEKWLGQCKIENVGRWARLMFENNKDGTASVLKPGSIEDNNKPWIPEGTDQDFRIISEIAMMN